MAINLYFHPTKLDFKAGAKICSYLPLKDLLKLAQIDKCFYSCVQNYLADSTDLLTRREITNRRIERIPGQNIFYPTPRYTGIPSSWFDDFQILLNGHPDLNVEDLNNHPLRRSLENPVPHLATLGRKMPIYAINGREESPDSTLQKVLGWILFTDYLLKREDYKKNIAVIEELPLGAVLSHCARIFHSIPIKFNQNFLLKLAATLNASSVKLVSAMAKYYYLQSNLGKDTTAPRLDASPHTVHAKIHRAVLTEHLKNKEFNSSIVTAWNPYQNRFTISFSGSLHLFTSSKWIEKRTNLEDKCKTIKHLEQHTPISIEVQLDSGKPLSYKMLVKVAKWFKISTHNISIKDFNLIQGSFAKNLHLQDDYPISSRIKRLNCYFNYFNAALAPETWQELFGKYQTVEMTNHICKNTFFGKRIMIKQLSMMFFATLTCAEPKILFDACRQIGKMTAGKKNQLPKTLKEQLFLSASIPKRGHNSIGQPIDQTNQKYFIRWENINGIEVAHNDLCKFCKEAWPLFEGFYWSLRQSGLDLTAMEALDQRIQALATP